MILCKNGACKGCSKCCKSKGKRSYNKESLKGDDLSGTKELGDGENESSWESDWSYD